MPINATVRLCGARSKQNDHKPCRQPAMLTKQRCRLHGGKNTGPKTHQGKANSAKANYKHGLYTNEAILERWRVRAMLKWRKELNSL